MDTARADEFSEILDRVKVWSPPERISLARQILETIDASTSGNHVSAIAPVINGIPVASVVGLLKTDGETPDDAECLQIVQEERWRKYGS